jgi:hypothetical protein
LQNGGRSSKLWPVTKAAQAQTGSGYRNTPHATGINPDTEEKQTYGMQRKSLPSASSSAAHPGSPVKPSQPGKRAGKNDEAG